MSVDPYVITITLDETRPPTVDQRYYHAKEVLCCGESFFCQYGDDPNKFGADRLTEKGMRLAGLMSALVGVRQFTIHNYHLGVLKGAAFDWSEVEHKIIARLLFAIKQGEVFTGALRYAQAIPMEQRLMQWYVIGRQYSALCAAAGIVAPEPTTPLRSIDLDTGDTQEAPTSEESDGP